MIAQVDSTTLTVNIENGMYPPPWRLSKGARKDELMGRAADPPIAVHCSTNKGTRENLQLVSKEV